MRQSEPTVRPHREPTPRAVALYGTADRPASRGLMEDGRPDRPGVVDPAEHGLDPAYRAAGPPARPLHKYV